MIELTEAHDAEDYEIARTLFREYAASLSVDLCFQGFEQELGQLQHMYGLPGGCLILGRETNVAIACVGVRRLTDADCEMKRLFVRDAARGNGLGRRLTLEAVRAARRLGYSRMFLDTLPDMKAARHLYATMGFEETEPYYRNPVEGAYFMVLDLIRLP